MFMLRLSSTLRRTLTIKAREQGVSLNAYIIEAIKSRLGPRYDRDEPRVETLDRNAHQTRGERVPAGNSFTKAAHRPNSRQFDDNQ